MDSTNLTKHLTLCTWNCRGFKTSVPYMRELCEKYDIVLINEHWLHSNRLSLFDEISNDHAYIARSSDESNADVYGFKRGQGGVSILWRKECISISPMQDCVHDRICGIRAQNKFGAIFNIFCVYMPARGCEGDLNATLDELSGIIENTEDGSLNLVLGDYNGDMGSMGGPRGVRRPSREGTHVAEFMLRQNLYAANLAADAIGPIDTHHGLTGSSCIDYALIDEELRDRVVFCEHL